MALGGEGPPQCGAFPDGAHRKVNVRASRGRCNTYFLPSSVRGAFRWLALRAAGSNVELALLRAVPVPDVARVHLDHDEVRCVDALLEIEVEIRVPVVGEAGLVVDELGLALHGDEGAAAREQAGLDGEGERDARVVRDLGCEARSCVREVVGIAPIFDVAVVAHGAARDLAGRCLRRQHGDVDVLHVFGDVGEGFGGHGVRVLRFFLLGEQRSWRDGVPAGRGEGVRRWRRRGALPFEDVTRGRGDVGAALPFCIWWRRPHRPAQGFWAYPTQLSDSPGPGFSPWRHRRAS